MENLGSLAILLAKCASKYEAKPGQIKPGQTAPNINSGKASGI